MVILQQNTNNNIFLSLNESIPTAYSTGTTYFYGVFKDDFSNIESGYTLTQLTSTTRYNQLTLNLALTGSTTLSNGWGTLSMYLTDNQILSASTIQILLEKTRYWVSGATDVQYTNIEKEKPNVQQYTSITL